ncbi:hypothetical protein MLD38_014508 [Melastoma candidum]|uniref:Uncharacterized protein n=1 Tax=Melastoma candidum TaxID=119954 RepID=A0ACB9RDK4_9MYRT|nr:hypothetical protein MLD38_014508 [Melastoma candidum]
MPPSGPRQDSAAAEGGAAPSFKRKPRLLSLILKAIIMTLITSVFFVFLGLAAIILLHLCLAGGLLHRRGNGRGSPGGSPTLDQLQGQHQQSSALTGLSPSDLRRVPKFRLLGYGKSPDCAICLDEVREGQWCRRLIGCGHVFHKCCVDTWLVKVAACPVCRRGVRSPREGDGGGRGRELKVDGFQGLLRL